MTERTAIRRRVRILAAALVVGVLGAAVPSGDALAGTGDDTLRLQSPGYVLSRSGKVTTIEIPDAATQNLVTGINNRGDTVGKYDDADGLFHGFLRDRRGRVRRIDIPGAQGTYALRVNDRSQIVGAYNPESPRVGVAGTKGFLLERGKVTTIAFPGAVYTQAFGINNETTVVGEYQLPDGTFHGFTWKRGRFTTLDVPGYDGSSVLDINAHKDVVGVVLDGDRVKGFTRRANGKVTVFEALDAKYTLALGINNRRQVVGYGIDDFDLTGARAFKATKGGAGRITRIDVLDAPRTIAGDINNRGKIAGNFENTAVMSMEESPMQPMGMAEVTPG